MKKLIAGLLLISAGYASAAEIAGNVALTTDYKFRGISQSFRNPAIQGGFDYSMDNGLYAGVWASSVAFGGSTEMDFYGGWTKDLNDNMSMDLGYMWYAYPADGGSPKFDYGEIYASLAFYGAKVGVNYSDDYFGGTGNFWYLFGQYSMPIGDIFSIDANLGFNSFDDATDFAAFLGTAEDPDDEYWDWSLGVSASAVGLDFSLAYVDPNIKNKYCDGKICDATAVFTISKSL